MKDGRSTRICNFHGSKNPNAKLTESQVVEIRRLFKEGATPTYIAKLFNTSRPNIWNICARRTWKLI